MKEKIINVKLEDLKYGPHYVRLTINLDHKAYLLSLMEGRIDVGPITITEDNIVIDGRHRVDAAKDLHWETIKARVIEDGNPLELVKSALQCNTGGALPPTKDDILQAIMGLLKKGFKTEKIAEKLSPIFPEGMLRALIRGAICSLTNERVDAAKRLQREHPEWSAEKICKIIGVKLKDFLDQVAPPKKDLGFVPQTLGKLKQRFTAFNKGNGHMITEIFKKLMNNEIDKHQAGFLINHVLELGASQARMYADWQRRWEAKNVS